MHTGRSSGITSFPRLILSTSEGSVQRANYNFITAADEPGTSHAPPNAPAAVTPPRLYPSLLITEYRSWNVDC